MLLIQQTVNLVAIFKGDLKFKKIVDGSCISICRFVEQYTDVVVLRNPAGLNVSGMWVEQ